MTYDARSTGWLSGYMASVNVMFAIDAFTEDNGGTIVVPGTHQRDEYYRPAAERLYRSGQG